MLNPSKVAALIISSVALGSVSTAFSAQQKGVNTGSPKSAAPSASATAVESLRTAQALARYGDANKDALSLITAARIVKDVGESESRAKRTGGKAGDSKNKPDLMTVASLIERAKALAGGRADLIALADDVGKSASRGAVNGPGALRTVVGRTMTDSYRVVFRGGEPARVTVSGDGDSDLDLFVYDEHGNQICRDDDASDDMYCAWTPRYTGSFTIRVRNLGVANQYRIVHN